MKERKNLICGAGEKERVSVASWPMKKKIRKKNEGDWITMTEREKKKTVLQQKMRERERREVKEA